MATLNAERKAKIVNRIQLGAVILFAIVACMNVG
ncbi:hypothetical protein PQB73_gp060 [Cronobacter phage LPCS28]|jgi:hypothetical protein|uniref:Uncharacterized protein n=1 Tax=Cronobacter phage LPCS28 TaxID=2924885 RepID=A0AAE9K855_9CAUD|nr:hypothetical protein PQB73_gp060 [Cronobacter phage LPCS28]UNY47153.1 hypothetical protein EHEKIMEA_00271 [Cronobacter phage LPCS28]